MPPKAKELFRGVDIEKLGNNSTYQLTLHHNEPKQDTTVVKRELTLGKSLKEIKSNMGAFRSIELVCEQTGELVYQRYANYDFYPLCVFLDDDKL